MTTADDDHAADDDPTASDLNQVDEIAARVRLAALALATPFAEMRQDQLAHEAARAAALLGDDDPETESRLAASRAGADRVAQLRTETIRARATPFAPDSDGAGISGVVTRRGEPEADATVSVVGGRKGTSARTGTSGTFAIAAPAGEPFVLSVRVGETEVHRDAGSTTLAQGQTIVRHIELDVGVSSETTPADGDLVEVPNLIGREHDQAKSVLARAGLEEGRITRRQGAAADVGRVVGQSPDAGTQFARLSTVDLTIGIARPKSRSNPRPKDEGGSG